MTLALVLPLMSWFGGGDKKDKKEDPPKAPPKATPKANPCSPNDYIADKLKSLDAENFAAAGILVCKAGASAASLELLLGRSSS